MAAAAAAATLPQRGDPSDKVVLHLIPAKIGDTINPSPFSTKLLAFVRFAGLDYEIGKASFMSNPNPRKLWPYIVHGPNLIPDSSDAAEYLAATYPEAAGKLLHPADPKAAALAHVVTRMLDEALFPALLYFRMAAPANQPHTEEAYFGSLPWLARKMVARSVFARTANRLYMQGVGKRTDPEILVQLKTDLGAVSALLGTQAYLFGKAPCVADASLFGMLDAALRDAAPDGGVRDAVGTFPNLVAYHARVRKQWFADFPMSDDAGGDDGKTSTAAKI